MATALREKIATVDTVEMFDDGDLRGAVAEIVRRCLSSDRIAHVGVEEDTDKDGDPLLRIMVVFKSAPSSRDAQKMMSLVGELRSHLRKLNEESFPLVSFISKNEAAKLQLATA